MKVARLWAAMLFVSVLFSARAEEPARPKEGAFKINQVISVVTAKTTKEEAEEFVKVFKESAKASHKMPGFLGMAVAQDMKEPGSFLVLSLWESEEALTKYVRSKGFGADHSTMGTLKQVKTETARYIIRDN